jgi:hypothetical protein
MSPIQNRHLSDRLIRAIESNAEEFAQSTVKNLRSSPRTESYHKVPDKDMYNRCYEIYHNLGRWLWEKSDQAVEERFNELGERRCEEGIPLAEVFLGTGSDKRPFARVPGRIRASRLGNGALSTARTR